MVEANVKVIGELKCFLEAVASDAELRALFTQSAGDFSRERKLPLQRIAALIINLPKRSLSIELQEFFASLEEGLEPATKGAFSLQRTKLQALFFHVWNHWLVNCFYQYYGEKAKRWRGFLVQAVDGSTLYLLQKKEVGAYFGTQGNQHGAVPMARVMQVHDVLNDLTLWGDIRPIGESEPAIMAKQVERLRADSLTLFDRCYPGFALLYLLLNQEVPRRFVMRCRVGFNAEVKAFMNSPRQSKTTEWRANQTAIATLRQHGYIITGETTIRIRMVKIKLPGGETEVLLTNLYDEALYSAEDLRYLYGLRWGIETAYYKEKNQQQVEQFSGHRVICIQQDYAASLFVANLQSLVEKQCEGHLRKINQTRKHRYGINRNLSWAALKHTVVRLFLQSDNEEALLLQLQTLFQRHLEPRRPGRHCPRTKKTKRLNGKYQTFTNYKRAV